jgi:hypothetical protein
MEELLTRINKIRETLEEPKDFGQDEFKLLKSHLGKSFMESLESSGISKDKDKKAILKNFWHYASMYFATNGVGVGVHKLFFPKKKALV